MLKPQAELQVYAVRPTGSSVGRFSWHFPLNGKRKRNESRDDGFSYFEMLARSVHCTGNVSEPG
jgi:hypothetical protein